MSAAGASGAQLVEGTKNDIDKLISGKISAAIIALVSPAKAASFPEIPGFKLLRIDVNNVGLNLAPAKTNDATLQELNCPSLPEDPIPESRSGKIMPDCIAFAA